MESVAPLILLEHDVSFHVSMTKVPRCVCVCVQVGR